MSQEKNLSVQRKINIGIKMFYDILTALQDEICNKSIGKRITETDVEFDTLLMKYYEWKPK